MNYFLNRTLGSLIVFSIVKPTTLICLFIILRNEGENIYILSLIVIAIGIIPTMIAMIDFINFSFVTD